MHSGKPGKIAIAAALVLENRGSKPPHAKWAQGDRLCCAAIWSAVACHRFAVGSLLPSWVLGEWVDPGRASLGLFKEMAGVAA
jgi:hypothetical protein